MPDKIGKSILTLLIVPFVLLLFGCAAKHTGESPAAAFVRQGEKLLDGGENKDAIAMFRKAVGLDPQSAEAYRGLGIAYYGYDDSYRAEIFMRKALQLNSHMSDLWGYLGDIYLQKDDEKKAMDFFERCPPDDPHYAELHFRLGKMRLEAEDLAAADLEFTKALAHADFWGGHWGKGILAKLKGDWDEALNWFRQAYNLEKEPEVLFGLAQSYDALGHTVPAYFYYTLLLGSAPGEEEASKACERLDVIEESAQLEMDTTGLRLEFSLNTSCDVSAGVCAKNGTVVKMLFSGTLSRGNYHLDWDGSDHEGKPVGNGEYIGFIVACDIFKLQKIILH